MENATNPVEAVTTETQAPAPQTNEVATETQSPPQPAIDYAAEYEKERERRERAEYALYKKKKAEKTARDIQENETGVVDSDDVKAQVEEHFVAMAMAREEKQSEDLIDEELMRITSNPDERKLIRFKYENAINRTGFSRLSIRQDLEDAQYLANKPRAQKERAELAQTAISKQTMPGSGMGTNLDRPTGEPDMSKAFSKYDWEHMQRANFSEAMIKAAYNQLKK